LSDRTTRPRATSICAIVDGPWSPSSRGTQPASSCCARSADTTTNSYAFKCFGRTTIDNLPHVFWQARRVGTLLRSRYPTGRRSAREDNAPAVHEWPV
jgi:hypothetical protein